MSTPFYDLASLVVVPSGYKASKVYAQKPLTTDGQLAFTRSTTATRVNSAGLIEASAINVPRLDYLNSTCPKLLLEPSRTNLALHSSAIDNAAWVKVQITLTANAAVSPDGTTNAEKIAIDSGISGGYAYQSIATTSSTVYTSSFFIKAAGINFTKFYSNVTGSYVTAVINLTTGAITNSGFAVTPTATNYGNGWWRVSYTQTSGGGSVPIYVDAGSTSNGGAITGNGTDGILIWGAQVEAGAYATSYIPTLGAAVTRGADAAYKTGISSLIGSTEGTIFFDLPPTTFSNTLSTYVLLELDGNIGAGYVHLYKEIGLKEARLSVRNGGTLQCDLPFTLSDNTPYKIAAVYKNNRFELYVNGVLRASDYSGTLAAITMDKIEVDGDSFNANSQIATNQVLLFKTALTQAQCEQLTA